MVNIGVAQRTSSHHRYFDTSARRNPEHRALVVHMAQYARENTTSSQPTLGKM